MHNKVKLTKTQNYKNTQKTTIKNKTQWTQFFVLIGPSNKHYNMCIRWNWIPHHLLIYWLPVTGISFADMGVIRSHGQYVYVNRNMYEYINYYLSIVKMCNISACTTCLTVALVKWGAQFANGVNRLHKHDMCVKREKLNNITCYASVPQQNQHGSHCTLIYMAAGCRSLNVNIAKVIYLPSISIHNTSCIKGTPVSGSCDTTHGKFVSYVFVNSIS